MHLFYDHVNDILQENIQSILEINLKDKDQIRNNKGSLDLNNIHSSFATDLFKNVYNTIILLSDDIKSQLLFQVVKVIVDKIINIQKSNDKHLEQLNEPDDLVVSCVFVLDAQNCIENFPDFKKKIKALLQKEYYKRLKVYFQNIIGLFNSSIKLGCLKSIDIMFIDIERNCLEKIFSPEWNEGVVNEIFLIFRENFNKGYCKILKTPHIQLIIVRSFIEKFFNYYVEELVHSIRSSNRSRIGDMELNKYRLKCLRCFNIDEKYKDTEVKKEEKKVIEKKVILDVKVIGDKNKDAKPVGKYQFPVKKLDNAWKKNNYNTAEIFKRINEDKNSFMRFLHSFKEGSPEPFSQNFTQYLGDNYIIAYVSKFLALLEILKCTQSNLKDSIAHTFKEHFRGIDGKVLLESLLFIREDYKEITKSADLKKFFIGVYDNS
jgi:hypothetical protein